MLVNIIVNAEQNPTLEKYALAHIRAVEFTVLLLSVA